MNWITEKEGVCGDRKVNRKRCQNIIISREALLLITENYPQMVIRTHFKGSRLLVEAITGYILKPSMQFGTALKMKFIYCLYNWLIFHII